MIPLASIDVQRGNRPRHPARRRDLTQPDATTEENHIVLAPTRSSESGIGQITKRHGGATGERELPEASGTAVVKADRLTVG